MSETTDWMGKVPPLGTLVGLAEDAAPALATALPAALDAAPAVLMTAFKQASTASVVASWQGLVVDVFVLSTFGMCLAAVLFHGLPGDGTTRDVVLGLFGTVSAMTLTVINYWRGSSSGSARKTEIMTNGSGQ